MSQPAVKHDREPMLQLTGISKNYGRIHTLRNVDMQVHAGEIHALIGENGAGKSTLAKIITGAFVPNTGSICLDGCTRQFHSPADSLKAGIAAVYQESSLIASMTVAQNMQLGQEPLVVRTRETQQQACKRLMTLNLTIDPCVVVGQLSAAERQMIEIARAVHLQARVMIFDEPTASLTAVESRALFALLDRLRNQRIAIIFISHALDEVLRVADQVTVLRDGLRVACAPAAQLNQQRLVRLLTGRDISATYYAADERVNTVRPVRGERLLEVNHLSMGSRVRDVSLSLYAGEIVGLAGPRGGGRSEIAGMIAGVFKRNDRRRCIWLRGKAVDYRSPAAAIRNGIAYVTGDRGCNGLFETLNIDANLYSGLLASRHHRFWVSRRQKKRLAQTWIDRLSIVASDQNLGLAAYSGGNQQKVVIGRALAQEPDIVFFDEPTHGVDVGAIEQIHTHIRELARAGKAVVVISSRRSELLSLADRILIVERGRIIREMATSEVPRSQPHRIHQG